MNRNKGFLLLESIVHIGILGIIMLILYSLIFLNLRYFSIISDKIEVQQQNNIIKHQLENRLKVAKNIYQVKTKNNKTISGDNFEADNVVSVFYETSTGAKDEFYFDLYNAKKAFLKKNLNSPGYELANYIENVGIEKSNNGKLIKLSIETKKGKQKYKDDFFIILRNY